MHTYKYGTILRQCCVLSCSTQACCMWVNQATCGWLVQICVLPCHYVWRLWPLSTEHIITCIRIKNHALLNHLACSKLKSSAIKHDTVLEQYHTMVPWLLKTLTLNLLVILLISIGRFIYLIVNWCASLVLDQHKCCKPLCHETNYKLVCWTYSSWSDIKYA